MHASACLTNVVPEVLVPAPAGARQSGGRAPMIRLVSMCIAFMGFCAHPAHAEGSAGLVVLGQDSGAIPAESLISELLGRFSEADEEELTGGITPDETDRSLIDGAGLPLSSSLTPSASTAGILRINMPLTSPLCVIGPDPISRRWLVANRDQLHRLGATCVLVKASGTAEVDAIRGLARPIPVHPLQFDQLAAQHGIRTVPVLLIGKGGPVQ